MRKASLYGIPSPCGIPLDTAFRRYTAFLLFRDSLAAAILLAVLKFPQ
jgi:hypothetical protein